MTICKNCGTQLDDGLKFCSNCGQTVDAGPAQPEPQPPQQEYQPPPEYPPQYQQPPQYQPPPQQGYQQPQYQQPPPQGYQQPPQGYQQQYQQPQYQKTGDDVQDNKLMAVLSYLGILLLIPLATGAHNTSPYVRFHLNQGIILVLGYLAFSVVYGILFGIATVVMIASSALGVILMVLVNLLWVVPLVFLVLGIINSATGKFKELPLIGKFKILK